SAQPGYPPAAYAPQSSYGSQQSYGLQTHPAAQAYPPAPGTVGYAPPPVWVPPVPVYPYAHWGRRVGAYLIDFAPAFVAMIPFWIGYVMFYVRIIQVTAGGPTGSSAGLFGELVRPALVWMGVGFVLMLLAFGWQWYNRWLIAGRTGQSMGKRVLSTKLVAEVNGQPIGAVNAFLRDLLHILDGVAYLGYLRPLWDAKRQTFSDLIMKTVVVDHPSPSNGPPPPQPTADHPYGPTA
ncbi:MAG: RDD family protein, partial [Propionibacteriaceae bacterium]